MAGTQYSAVLIVQWLLLALDLGLNAAAPLLYRFNTVQLVLYVLQDTCQVLALIILFLAFFSTFVFQAGLVSLLISKFQVSILVATVYLSLSVPYHVWSLRRRWERELDYVWSPGLLALFVMQRTAAVIHYYFYKRTTLLLADPRYYRDSHWLREKMTKNK